MADNVTTNAGSGGDVVAADDISGVKYQRIKLIHGADGTNDGDVASANPLPVEDAQLSDVATQTTLSAINTKIPASPATAGNQTTANSSLTSIDGHVDGIEGLLGTIDTDTGNIATDAATTATNTTWGSSDTQPQYNEWTRAVAHRQLMSMVL